MSEQYESALQAAKERVLFTAGQWGAWMGAGAKGAEPPVRAALDYALRLARAIGAAEACDHENCSATVFGPCSAQEAVDAIIREMEGGLVVESQA